MFIRCPNCGRRGYLPDDLAPAAHSLRCRKCQAHFQTPALVPGRSERRGVTLIDQPSNRRASDDPVPFLAANDFAGFDEPEATPRHRSPGDSQYELTFTLKDSRGDSAIDWENETQETPYLAHGAVDEMPSSGEIEAIGPITDEPPLSEPWHYGFIESWGVVLIRLVLVLIGVSIPLLGVLVWRAIDAGHGLQRPTPTLIAGFACAISLLVISLPLMLLVALLGDLVRDIRRLRHHLDRETRTGPG